MKQTVFGVQSRMLLLPGERGETDLEYMAIGVDEQMHRKMLAVKARNMIADRMPIEEEDETSIMTSYHGYFMQIAFSPLHPLIMISLAKQISNPGNMKKLKVCNALNLTSVLGTHALDQKVGCYTYRVTQWLDTELTPVRFDEILDRCVVEASRAYQQLSAV